MMTLGHDDLQALWLTFQLATVTVCVLLIVGTPLAWWLVRTRSRFRTVIEAVVALPLVLPPTPDDPLRLRLRPPDPAPEGRRPTVAGPADRLRARRSASAEIDQQGLSHLGHAVACVHRGAAAEARQFFDAAAAGCGEQGPRAAQLRLRWPHHGPPSAAFGGAAGFH